VEWPFFFTLGESAPAHPKCGSVLKQNIISDLPLVILGAGGHAKVVLDSCLAAGQRVLGLSDIDATRHGTSVLGVIIRGGDEWVRSLAPDAIRLVNGIGSVANPSARIAAQAAYSASGYRFARVVHPSAVVSVDVKMQDGVQVMAGTVIQAGCRLATGAIINTRAAVDHDCVIGAHAHVAPGAVLSGGVYLGDGAHIGCGASVIQGVRIGTGAVIGAGAAVISHIADGMLAVGVPAKEIGKYR